MTGDLLMRADAIGRINALVRSRGSQAALAREIGITSSHLSMMLSGIRPFDVRLLRLAGLREVERFMVVGEPATMHESVNADAVV